MIDTSWLRAGAPEGKKRVFYFTAPDFAIQNLQERKIKISSFSACNDFFELSHVKLDEKKYRLKHTKWQKEISSKCGLICFSSKWKSPLLWGHYTERGKGICLVLDVVSDGLQKVKYLDNKKECNNNELPDVSDENFRTFCSTKTKIWEYESEERFFVNFPEQQELSKNELVYSGMWFHSFGEQISLVGIINGPRPTFGKRQLMEASGLKGNFFQCRPAFGSFEITPQNVETLWKK